MYVNHNSHRNMSAPAATRWVERIERVEEKRVRVADTYADVLLRDGVVVVPILNEPERAALEQEVKSIEWPEFDDLQRPYVLGGFGAYGFASSFHHPTVRRIRSKVKNELRDQLFREFATLKFPGTEQNLAAMFDRVCCRKGGWGTISAEAWHQDVCSIRDPAYPDDVFFGGWTNLSDANQKFICKRGTQNQDVQPGANYREGFDLVVDPVAREALKADHDEVVVPPGHAIIIQQKLLHSVNPKLPPNVSYRIFHGFRLTQSSASLPKLDVQRYIHELSTPRLPSGQVPPMFAKMHVGLHMPAVKKFTDKLKPTFRVPHAIKNHPDAVWPGEFGTRMALPLRGRIPASEEESYEYSEADVQVLMPESLS